MRLRIVALLICIGLLGRWAAARGPAMSLVRRIQLPGVKGQMDHLAWDGAQRVFLAAKKNNTVEVMNLAQGRRVQSFAGVDTPQGIYFDRPTGRLFVACDGYLAVLQSRTGHRLATVQGFPDADNIVVDGARRRMYLGYGEGGVGVLSLDSLQVEKRITLPEHPEFIVLTMSPPRLYANLPDRGQIAVIDAAAGKVLTRWQLPARGNHPLVEDPQTQQLLAVAREPAELLACREKDGRVQETVPGLCAEADEMFADTTSGQVFVTGESGHLSVLGHRRGRLFLEADVTTSPGARTCLWLPESRQLLVACPDQPGREAELRIYQAGR